MAKKKRSPSPNLPPPPPPPVGRNSPPPPTKSSANPPPSLPPSSVFQPPSTASRSLDDQSSPICRDSPSSSSEKLGFKSQSSPPPTPNSKPPPASVSSDPASNLPVSGSLNPVIATVKFPGKPSWKDVVHGSSQKMSKKGDPFLLDFGEICIQIPNSVITKNQHNWKSFIIAQFHGKAPSPGALHAISNNIWSSRLRNITVSKLNERSFLIKISCPVTRNRVLVQGMWHIENQAMFVAKWEPGVEPEVPELTATPVWVDFHNVPPHFYSEEGLEHIAGLVGDPVVLHPNTASMTNLEVARVFTIIDPTKPLPEAVNVRFETGHTHRVLVSSPWLPPICAHCNEVGHSIKRCPSAPITCQDCNSSGHLAEACPRAKKTVPPSDSQIQSKSKKPKNQKWKRKEETAAEVQEGTIKIDIGLEKLQNQKTAASKNNLHSSSKKKVIVSSDAVDSTSEPEEDTASSEAETSECNTEEESSSSEEESFTPVISKRNKKMQNLLEN